LNPARLLHQRMPHIVAVRTKDDSSREAIAVVLSQDAVCLGPDGQPWAGVSLNAELARSLAERLLYLAREIEERPHAQDRSSAGSLDQVASILVVHDGSAQGHRASTLALDMASRSPAAIQLVGVYGVQPGNFEPSNVAEDYQWQRGWLEKLIRMYSERAVKESVDLRATLIAAGDQGALSDVFDSGAFDLIVLPRKLSDDHAASDASRAFQQWLAGANESKILFCP
jgi:hypothetical protein